MSKLLCLLLLCLPPALSLGQDRVQAPPTMKLTPASFNVDHTAGVVYARVTNTGDGTLAWLTIDNQTWTSSSSDRPDTISVAFTANSAATQRTGTVTVISNASNSPQRITIKQAGAPILPVLSVSDSLVLVPWNARQAQITVRNSGNGSLSWTARSDQGWAAIQSGASGKDSGRIVLAFPTNPSLQQRTALITITAAGAAGSPAGVRLIQDSCETAGTIVLVRPVNEETFPSDSVALRWRHGVPSVTSYCLEVLGDLGSLFIADSTLTDTTYALSALERGYDYYWRVRPRNPVGWGAWSSLWKFSREVDLPGAVTLVAPPDRALLAGDTVRLQWKPGAPAVRRYWLELAADSLFASADVDSALTDSVCTRTALDRGTSYVWRVRAGNNAGWGPFSPVRHFAVPLTGIAARVGSLPAAFRLHRNYPNPFNPATVIRYDLPSRCHVTLAVYTMLGERVAELARGPSDAGVHEVRFDARNLPSGVYLCRIHAGPYVGSQKLLLVR